MPPRFCRARSLRPSQERRPLPLLGSPRDAWPAAGPARDQWLQAVTSVLESIKDWRAGPTA